MQPPKWLWLLLPPAERSAGWFERIRFFSRPQPIQESESRSSGDDDELSPVHSSDHHSREEHGEHGNRDAVRQAETIGFRLLFPQDWQRGGDGAIDKKP